MDCPQIGSAGSVFSSFRLHLRPLLRFFVIATLVCLPIYSKADVNAEKLDDAENLEIALALANVLRAARSEIASQQPLINDATIEDKGLHGKRLVELVSARLKASNNDQLLNLPADTRLGALVQWIHQQATSH